MNRRNFLACFAGAIAGAKTIAAAILSQPPALPEDAVIDAFVALPMPSTGGIGIKDEWLIGPGLQLGLERHYATWQNITFPE